MKQLNYDIQIGTHFFLPRASWQVGAISGNYRVVERTVNKWDEVRFLCVSSDDRNQNVEVLIPEMVLAYLLGYDVEAEPNVVYDGKYYQPTGLDDFRVATEDDGTAVDEPFWYLGHWGNRYSISVNYCTGNWCFFKLPWD